MNGWESLLTLANTGNLNKTSRRWSSLRRVVVNGVHDSFGQDGAGASGEKGWTTEFPFKFPLNIINMVSILTRSLNIIESSTVPYLNRLSCSLTHAHCEGSLGDNYSEVKLFPFPVCVVPGEPPCCHRGMLIMLALGPKCTHTHTFIHITTHRQ